MSSLSAYHRHHQALLISLQYQLLKYSGDWLHAMSISSCGLRQDEETARVVVGLRLGARLCEPHAYTYADLLVILLVEITHSDKLRQLYGVKFRQATYIGDWKSSRRKRRERCSISRFSGRRRSVTGSLREASDNIEWIISVWDFSFRNSMYCVAQWHLRRHLPFNLQWISSL